MRFRRASTDSWELRDIHPLFVSLLAELPKVAARHKKAQSRLYPDPIGGADYAELRRDWKEHVRPELERLFASSRETVAGDVSALDGPNHGGKLVIPGGHLAAWLNSLNQARLVIVEESNFSEADLDHREPPDLATRRGLSLLKMHFYAHLQELLVEAAG
jgi:Domain of unknown function (DUF2017).